MKTARGNWTLQGINLIPSDSIYQNIQKAINSGNLTEKHLKRISGHAYPIKVDYETSTITFCNF